MSSVAPYSVGTSLTSLKTNYSAASSQSPPLHSRITCAAQIQVEVEAQPLVLVQKESQLKRREAIGLAFSFGLHTFFQPQVQPATAAEAVPCELTEAPSGLAFCDRKLGTGPQPLKGQLIKVTVLFFIF